MPCGLSTLATSKKYRNNTYLEKDPVTAPDMNSIFLPFVTTFTFFPMQY